MKLLKKNLIFSVLAALLSCTGKVSQTEKWDFFEVSLTGPSAGNQFKDVSLSAVFFQNEDTLKTTGMLNTWKLAIVGQEGNGRRYPRKCFITKSR